MSRPAPPSGVVPPAWFELDGGTRVDLGPLAGRLCGLYFTAYPDDVERYGSAGQAWCDHDSRYLLAWALEDARIGAVDCVAQVQWLGRVLAARDFPLERLTRHVEMTAEVVRTAGLGELGEQAARRLELAAGSLSADPPSS